MTVESDTRIIEIAINGMLLRLPPYQAEHCADALLMRALEWDETAVYSARAHMRHKDSLAGYDGEARAADDARRHAEVHREVAVALLHACGYHRRCAHDKPERVA